MIYMRPGRQSRPLNARCRRQNRFGASRVAAHKQLGGGGPFSRRPPAPCATLCACRNKLRARAKRAARCGRRPKRVHLVGTIRIIDFAAAAAESTSSLVGRPTSGAARKPSVRLMIARAPRGAPRGRLGRAGSPSRQTRAARVCRAPAPIEFGRETRRCASFVSFRAASISSQQSAA